MGEQYRPTSSEEAVEHYATMVYRLAYAQVRNKADADDIFQEVFLRYVKNVKNFNSKEHEKFWLIRTTVNCSKNLWRSAWFRKTVPLDDKLVFEGSAENTLTSELCKLPEKFRIVLHLFYYEDFSVAKIAEILGQKEPTIRTWLTRARVALGKSLGEEFIND
ncbi:ECF RNA polymerase sigma factor SigE [Oxobacter pfennigii]|uniref:ECF RNA polymerase sigma factor SigE n=1 Tax=Oxobacter pfennigii TaxID=36849 RepID=A0A0P8WAV9_9CLOT|nr:sigma-70 family RNA polymerase sigma factor [Oxobacter pfennigii]KPU45771.1 ECF RNA polymerase sigma factor SigE [Oxobacter pfennigii]